MGKGRIVNNIGEGEYLVEVVLDTARAESLVQAIAGRIANINTVQLPQADIVLNAAKAELVTKSVALSTAISEYATGILDQRGLTVVQNEYRVALFSRDDAVRAKAKLTLEVSSLERESESLTGQIGTNPQVIMWCADLSASLSGDVGTIEIPGERTVMQVKPGYAAGAMYLTSIDGSVQPGVSGTPESVYYNLAMLPGWQKYKPTFRVGVITEIVEENDECNVTLDAATSSVDDLSVNQNVNLIDIPISYMDCNAAAFEVNDRVLVQFQGQDWANPQVVGFESNPKPCRVWTFAVLATSDSFPTGIDGGEPVLLTFNGGWQVQHFAEYTAQYPAGLVYGSTDWKGRGEVVSWKGTRIPELYQPVDYYNNIITNLGRWVYYNGAGLYQTKQSTEKVLGAAIQPGNFLVIIESAGSNTEFRVRVMPMTGNDNDYDETTNPDGALTVGLFEDIGYLAKPHLTWFFNESANEAQTVTKNNIFETYFRIKIKLTGAGYSTTLLSYEEIYTDVETSHIETDYAFGSPAYVSNQTLRYERLQSWRFPVAVDYRGNVEVVAYQKMEEHLLTDASHAASGGQSGGSSATIVDGKEKYKNILQVDGKEIELFETGATGYTTRFASTTCNGEPDFISSGSVAAELGGHAKTVISRMQGFDLRTGLICMEKRTAEQTYSKLASFADSGDSRPWWVFNPGVLGGTRPGQPAGYGPSNFITASDDRALWRNLELYIDFQLVDSVQYDESVPVGSWDFTNLAGILEVWAGATVDNEVVKDIYNVLAVEHVDAYNYSESYAQELDIPIGALPMRGYCNSSPAGHHFLSAYSAFTDDPGEKTTLWHLSGGDAVTLTGLTGANPVFREIGLF